VNSLASTDFHFSIDSSRLNSPRPGSIRASVSRKRALSSSPYSDSFDISSMIRYSPNSLVSFVNGSRASSGASGSYGHLSASALSPALGLHSAMPPHLQHILRSGGFLHGLPGSHHASPTSSMFSLAAAAAHHPLHALSSKHPMPLPAHHHGLHQPHLDMPMTSSPSSVHHNPTTGHSSITTTTASTTHASKKSDLPSSNRVAMVEADSASNAVSQHSQKKSRIKREGSNGSLLNGVSHAHQTLLHHQKPIHHPTASLNTASTTMGGMKMAADTTDPKDEPADFIETNCHWRDCGTEFMTQDDLVKHINNDHIHSNKKSFVCRWEECSRDEKPFKAQYMLVVHMRRHTGEKPHKCTVSD
jgi:transcriptional activator cubitus interruptus